jgi:hypothetical protein
MRLSLCLLFALTLLPFSSFAQVDPSPNSCGFYFDEGATQNCFFTTVSYQQITGYICLTNLTDHSGISAWECRVEVTSNGLVAPCWLLLHGSNFSELPDFVVILSIWNPIPWSPNVPLAEFTAFVVHPGASVYFRIVASSTPSMPGHNGMVVAAGNNEFLLIPIYNSTGYDSQGVPNICAAVNSAGPCPVPTENTTWGGVKAMFD